jgi:hypothetical protein
VTDFEVTLVYAFAQIVPTPFTWGLRVITRIRKWRKWRKRRKRKKKRVMKMIAKKRTRELIQPMNNLDNNLPCSEVHLRDCLPSLLHAIAIPTQDASTSRNKTYETMFYNPSLSERFVLRAEFRHILTPQCPCMMRSQSQVLRPCSITPNHLPPYGLRL